MNGRRIVALGAALAGIAVVLGAFGAHGLRSWLGPQLLDTWEIGVRYHLAHALGLVLVGLFAIQSEERGPSRDAGALVTVARLFLLGIALFSGSLYLLALTGVRMLGAITPLGGLAFIAGWFALARAALRGA